MCSHVRRAHFGVRDGRQGPTGSVEARWGRIRVGASVEQAGQMARSGPWAEQHRLGVWAGRGVRS